VRSFEVSEGTPREFVERVRGELGARGLDSYVEIFEDQIGFVVRFKYMGMTELRYRVEPEPRGFRALLSGERVSPFHAPFRQRFDDRFDQVLEKVGARTI
jgi:hypothetical protein